MNRILRLDNLLILILLLSFFLPWTYHLQGVSDTPLNGVSYMLVFAFLVMPPIGFLIAVIPILSAAILIRNAMRKNTQQLKTIVSIFTILLFILSITYHTWSGVLQGKQILASLAYQFSQIGYGVYVGLVSALCLYMVRRFSLNRFIM